MLKLKDVYKTFNRGTVNEKKAIDGLNLTLEDGDFVTVIGGNGAGKSTTLNLIAGVFPVDSGKIVLNGSDPQQPARAQARTSSSAVSFRTPCAVPRQPWASRKTSHWRTAAARCAA